MTKPIYLTSEEIAQLQLAEQVVTDRPQRTKEQIEAIYSHGKSILVSASAGSGKTFVMVERILDMVERGVGLDQLFISTFTVKAAGELKERLEKKLTTSLSQTSSEVLKGHLANQLSLLSTADIGTMDAFTQKLLNQHGYLLGISPNFRIMQDKSEQDALKQEVFSDLFEDYMRGADQEAFKALVTNFLGSRKDTGPFREVVNRIYSFAQATSSPEAWLSQTFLKGQTSLVDADSLPVSWLTNLSACLAETARGLADLTELEDYPRLLKSGKPSKKYQDHLAMIAQLETWSQSLYQDYGKAGLGRLAQELTALLPSGSEVTVAGVKHPVFKDLQAQLVGLRHLDIIFHYQAQATPLLQVLQAFVQDFSAQYLQAKIQEAALEFSDVAHLAIRILEEFPEVRAAYQTRYEEVMVDEYQDNSHIQERMLELLSNGHNRFMVGDIKQSIYRFRQADPQIFAGKFKTFQTDPSQGQLIILKENFRSQSEVLDSTNAVFRHLMDETVGDLVYDQSHFLLAGSDKQKEPQPQHKTQVLIYDTDIEENQEETEESLSQGEIDLVAKEIIRLHNEEGVAFEEITLLVASRTRNAALIRRFDQLGIPLVTDDGASNYLQSVEVMVMLDTLRSLDNPLNDYALVALLRSPMFIFDEDDLARLALQGDKISFYDKLILADRGQGQHPELCLQGLDQKIRLFLETYQNWRRFAKSHSLYDLIWKIYQDRLYYDYVASLPKAEQAQANLYALALRAHQFEQTGFKGLARFVRLIDKILETDNDLAEVPLAKPKSAVNLMTIHKSKGLEFPYVFILNLDKTFSMEDTRSAITLSRDLGIGIKYLADVKGQLTTSLPKVKISLETLTYQANQAAIKRATLSEQMRLLYVAMTRAEKSLYLVGKGSRSKLEQAYQDQEEQGRLPVSRRETYLSFQDWLLAIDASFGHKDLAYAVTYLGDNDLTLDKIGQPKSQVRIQSSDQTDNRQTQAIADAVRTLESVAAYNQSHQAAIDLPTVRTPSQIKAFYQPVMDLDGVDQMEQEPLPSLPKFDLPDFSGQEQVTGAALGSAVHELMQRLRISNQVTMADLTQALAQVQISPAVKARINLDKLLAFFGTELGQLLQTRSDRLYREAPFAMLQTDPVSQETYVIRGILDGYLVLDDRLVLFDYKTDRFSDPEKLRTRYQGQMDLYAQALSRSYGISQVDKYLILLGGQELVVLDL